MGVIIKMGTLSASTKTKWVGKKPDPTNSFGFIYKITNLINGRMYIGKKQYSFTKYKTAEGRRRKKFITDSGWESYKGSSKYLHDDIKKHGEENFKFEIIWNCSSKGMLHWMEIKELVLRNVLLERLEGSDLPLYYNRAIAGIRFIPKGIVK